MRWLAYRSANRLVPTTLWILGILLGTPAFAQEYPTRPITLMVFVGAGGPTDLLARAIGSGLSEQFGKPVIIENRPGAGGAIASLATLRSAPDGYTILLTANTSHTLNPFVQKGTKYDPVKDFTPITMIGKAYNVIVVNKALAVNTLPELIEKAKSKPKAVAVGTVGLGARLASARLSAATGASLLDVPYPDGAKGTQALVSGEVDMFYDGAGLAKTRVEEGLYKAIAVLSTKRIAALPDVPAVGEFIPGFEVPLWFGVVAPAGLSEDVKQKLNKSIIATFVMPRVQEAAKALGLEIVGNSSEEFGKLIAAEAATNPELVKTYNLGTD